MAESRDLQGLREAYNSARNEYVPTVKELQSSMSHHDAVWKELQVVGDSADGVLYGRFIEARRRWVVANKTYDAKRKALDNAVRDFVDQAGYPVTPRLGDYGVH